MWGISGSGGRSVDEQQEPLRHCIYSVFLHEDCNVMHFVIHIVMHINIQLPKLNVEGSSPYDRSIFPRFY